MNEWNESWPQHWELHALHFTNRVWVLLRSTGLWTLKGCETGPSVYSLQRQHFLLSYLKTLSVGPAGVELMTSRMAARCSTNWVTDARCINTKGGWQACIRIQFEVHGRSKTSLLMQIWKQAKMDWLVATITCKLWFSFNWPSEEIQGRLTKENVWIVK